jgi:hypothetical protein
MSKWARACLVRQFNSQLQFIQHGPAQPWLRLTDSAAKQLEKADKTDDKLTIHELAAILPVAWTMHL